MAHSLRQLKNREKRHGKEATKRAGESPAVRCARAALKAHARRMRDFDVQLGDFDAGCTVIDTEGEELP